MRSFKTVDPASGFADFWYSRPNLPDELNAQQAYANLGLLRRCVDILANCVQTLPNKIVIGDKNVTEELSLIDQAEAINLLVTYGAVYGQYYALPKRLGYKTKLEIIHPLEIRWQYNRYGELEYFERNLPGMGQTRYDPAELIWWWEQNLEDTRGPGRSIVYSALVDANLINAGSRFSFSWYQRGGPLKLLSVEGNPPEDEKRKVKEFWNRLTRGFKNWYETIVLKKGTEVLEIGGDAKAGDISTITKGAEERLLAALGIPASMVFANSANYATAAQDARNLITYSGLPFGERIIAPLNKKVWLKQGAKFEFEPNMAPAFQSVMVDLAGTVTQLRDAGFITTAQGQKVLGVPVTPVRVTRQASPPPEAAPMPQQSEVASLDLSAWQRKAINALAKGKPAAVQFTSDSIPADEHARITQALGECKSAADVRAVFATRHDSIGALARALEKAVEATK